MLDQILHENVDNDRTALIEIFGEPILVGLTRRVRNIFRSLLLRKNPCSFQDAQTDVPGARVLLNPVNLYAEVFAIFG